MLVLIGAGIWYLDIRPAPILARQYQSGSFANVKGEVLAGTVTQWTGSKGAVHYHPSISYRYEVNGQTYKGNRYRYDGHPSFYNEAEANQVLAAHPKGSEIEVYYNPDKPADAVLSPGLDTADLAFPFLSGAITNVFLSTLIKLVKEMDRPGKTKPVAGGVKIIDDRMTIRVRLPRYQAGAMCSLVATILCSIAGLVFQHPHLNSPPVAMGLLTLAGVSLVSLMVYFFLRRRNELGSQDLVIDEGARMMELPLTYKRRETMRLTFSDVSAVTVEQITSRRRSAANAQYTVKLQLREGPPQILTTLKQDRAESFADWLRQTFKLDTEVREAGARGKKGDAG